ncbi:MAG: glycosyltransferase [Pseudomonadota bacterium]|nr:glycosyltransferase [Pseudomonadota bacterium]
MSKKGRPPLISVIIPTFNRAELLRLSLRSLTRQSLPKQDFEVIVIDDGSSDHTRQVCRELEKSLRLRYFSQANAGISTAKNLGVFTAQAPILFFFDDDDVADRNLLKEHLRSHREHPEEYAAVLGYTTWDASLEVTPVMHYVMDVGQFLFAYKLLRDGQELDFTYFWGGRSSCKRSLLVRHGVFRQQFRFGSEDIELGWRLSKFGFKVFFNRRAVSYMVRPITYTEFCRRCEKQGRSQHWFYKAHPDPVIRDYCMISKAEEKWRFIEKRLHDKTARVAEIEALLASSSGKASQPLMNELHSLYGWTFNAFKLKGVVEESRADRSTEDPSLSALPQARVSEADLRHVLEKGRGLPPLRQKENILVCDPLLPMFDRASGSLRLFHILKALVQLGYHVTFISRDSDHAERYGPILRDLGIETYAGDPAAKEQAGSLIIAPFVDLEDILRKRSYKAAILCFWHLAEYYMTLIREHSPGTAVIVDSVDIHFLREAREAELKQDDRLKAQVLENKKREISVYGKADRVWVVTTDDRSAIQPLVPEVPIDIIPNIHEKIEDTKTFGETTDLLFVGNFNHRPNIDSVEFLCDEILPLLQAELPDVKTHIVGNNPPEAVKKRASDRVVVTGYVENLAPYLKTARISLSPLRYGAGMKGKVGEALSWGLPVITTSIGAEGMGLVDGHDALIADDPREFAMKVIRLYNDAELWNRLSANGKRTVETQWSPEAIRQRLTAALQEIDRKNETISIVILTFNELEYTKRCVESIRQHTPEAHEIVFVDNGSTDGTVKWLRKLVRENSRYRLIENKKNLGFAKGCNQGIEAASGGHILLLNNDTLVTAGWLAGMMECLKNVDDAGIVGPMTNHISGIQQVGEVGYKSLDELADYAIAFRGKNRHRRIETRRVVGFCMLFHKRLIDEIGPLDESFGTGNFEDDDFCARAALAGYRNVIAGDVFIHHFGSRSFIGNRIDYGSSMSGNRRIYADKWRTLEQKAEEGRKIRCLAAREQARERFLRGDVKAAVDLCLEAIRFRPVDYRPYHELAEYLLQAGRFEEALEALKQAPEGTAGAERFVLEGLCREAAKEPDVADSLADRAIAANASYAPAFNLKGILMFGKGATEEAKAFFERAAQADPSWGEPLTNLGVLAWAAGRTAEAFDLLEKGFILSPHLSDLAERYHSAAVSLGRQESASAVFREAKSLHPVCRHIRFLLIDLLVAQERYDESMAEIEQAMPLFEIDDGFLASALQIRDRIGPYSGMKGVSKKRARVSLCMIVKNEESNVARCLTSAKPVVDEIIVVDTGSTDRTKALCQALGAKVYDFAWTEDFAEARNVSLAKATGDWILVLDADEVISPRDYPVLRKCTAKAPKKPGAFMMTTRNYLNVPQQKGWQANDGQYAEEAGSGWFPSDKVRLFSRDKRIRFDNRVHEIVEPSLRKLGLEPETIAAPVHHYGKLDTGKTIEKGKTYYALGKKKLEDNGADVKSVRELAIQAMELGNQEEAFALWTQVVALTPDSAQAHMNLAHLHLEAGRFWEALDAGRKAMSLDPAMKEACLNCAMGEFYAGDMGKTITILERLLERVEHYPPATALLAAACLVRGHREKAARHLDNLRERGFGDSSFLRAYAERLRQAGRPVEAGTLLEAAGKSSQDSLIMGVRQTVPPDRPSLSLCMIARDEEDSIGRALSSVASVVSEMIVVDTGSKDRTREIALELGAKVYDFPWCDDFAAARNVSLSRATGDWIFILDADEALAPVDAERLVRLTETAGEDIAGFFFQTRNYTTEMNVEGWTRNDGRYAAEEAGSGWFPSGKVRLFRNDPRVRYEGAVHEMIEQAMERQGLRWADCEVPIHHYGPLTGRSKGEFYYRLGQKKIVESAGNARAVYELAVQAGRLRRFAESIALWQRYLALDVKDDLPLAFLNLGHAYLETGQYGKAIDASGKALSIDPGLKEAALNLAMAEFYEGCPEKSAERLENLLSTAGDYPPAAALLCAAYLTAGQTAKADERIRALSEQALNPAAFFQVYAARLREVGRCQDAEILLAAASRLWADELRFRGLDGSPEEVSQIMSAVGPDIPPLQAPSSPDARGDRLRP